MCADYVESAPCQALRHHLPRLSPLQEMERRAATAGHEDGCVTLESTGELVSGRDRHRLGGARQLLFTTYSHCVQAADQDAAHRIAAILGG